MKVKLSGQPFDVLVALIEKPGQVVTREELHDKLWSQDTFVDFEQGLNKAINKVREALGDDADNPRFIETLPRGARGYRFLVPLMQPTEPTVAVITATPVIIKPTYRYQGLQPPTCPIVGGSCCWQWSPQQFSSSPFWERWQLGGGEHNQSGS